MEWLGADDWNCLWAQTGGRKKFDLGLLWPAGGNIGRVVLETRTVESQIVSIIMVAEQNRDVSHKRFAGPPQNPSLASQSHEAWKTIFVAAHPERGAECAMLF